MLNTIRVKKIIETIDMEQNQTKNKPKNYDLKKNLIRKTKTTLKWIWLWKFQMALIEYLNGFIMWLMEIKRII